MGNEKGKVLVVDGQAGKPLGFDIQRIETGAGEQG